MLATSASVSSYKLYSCRFRWLSSPGVLHALRFLHFFVSSSVEFPEVQGEGFDAYITFRAEYFKVSLSLCLSSSPSPPVCECAKGWCEPLKSLHLTYFSCVCVHSVCLGVRVPQGACGFRRHMCWFFHSAMGGESQELNSGLRD